MGRATKNMKADKTNASIRDCMSHGLPKEAHQFIEEAIDKALSIKKPIPIKNFKPAERPFKPFQPRSSTTGKIIVINPIMDCIACSLTERCEPTSHMCLPCIRLVKQSIANQEREDENEILDKEGYYYDQEATAWLKP